ncbi:hypothetical protein ISX56_27820, partial [Serratia ureilytica]|nr:hypothetical protein [Serratia ureilytica]
TYPGADAETLENSVTQVIEQQLTGLDGLLYFSVDQQRQRFGQQQEGGEIQHAIGLLAQQHKGGESSRCKSPTINRGRTKRL